MDDNDRQKQRVSPCIPCVTVAVCTHNRCRHLEPCLGDLADQVAEEKRCEVVVVDNASTDPTKGVVAKFPEISYLYETRTGLSHARNRAITETSGEYIAFIDDDCRVPSDWVANALEIIDSERPLAFGGPSFPFYDSPKPKWFRDEYATTGHGNAARELGRNEFLSGMNMVFHRSVFDLVGTFDPSLGMTGKKVAYAEETALQIKLWKEVIEPQNNFTEENKGNEAQRTKHRQEQQRSECQNSRFYRREQRERSTKNKAQARAAEVRAPEQQVLQKETKTTKHKEQSTKHKARSTPHDLRSTNHEPRTTNYEPTPVPIIYYSPRLTVQHLVRPDKMTWRWILKNRWADGRDTIPLLAGNDPVGTIYFLKRLFWIVSRGLGSLTKAFFARDKAKYPCWQNYVYEETSYYLRRLGYLWARWKLGLSTKGNKENKD